MKGPTPDPCGVCDACIEIAEGRDIDVLEIDAATHTGVDNVREVVIEGLAIAPVRNRYKVFIIDEVHMLSASSFNALLKSIEEPPPHVIFMMATTEQHKIPDTVLSRSQVYEFRTISGKIVAERLRLIANEEKIEIPDAGLLLLARAGEGSMRDSLSAFDQVRAFAGDQITTEDVVTVLGLVGRDLVFDMLEAIGGGRRAGGVRARRARHRARLRPAPAVPRAGARHARPADPVGGSEARAAIRTWRPTRRRSGWWRWRGSGRARTCCARSTC